jgi:uncharacterized membrane protein YfcA
LQVSYSLESDKSNTAMVDLTLTTAGFLVGMLVGFTGVGGGALMTPFLIFYGLAPAVAVGTDLVYAAITKTGGLVLHHRRGTVHWGIVALLALGSLPAAVLSLALLHYLSERGVDYSSLITLTLGISLILTSLFLLFRSKETSAGALLISSHQIRIHCRLGICTVAGGALLGVLVTLSSVGAGALGAAILMLLYPQLRTVNVVGIDVAHAALLTAASGFGHLQLGTVDFTILWHLLLGSLPGIALGTRLGIKLPELFVRRALGALLLSVGVSFSI